MSVMRFSTFCAAAYAAFFGLNAQAAESAPRGVSAAFGNTIRTEYPDGRYQRIWLHADGGWDAIGRRGKPSSGTWTLKEDKVCLKQVKPFAAPFKYCTRIPADGVVGVKWTSKDMAGEPIKLTLVKGIERP
jgi:hypothetical protein